MNFQILESAEIPILPSTILYSRQFFIINLRLKQSLIQYVFAVAPERYGHLFHPIHIFLTRGRV